jgi:hypothetical protein
MGNQNQVDWAGLDLVINNVYTGATEPGETGVELTSADLDQLAGITPGTAEAELAVVTDASNEIAGFASVTSDVFVGPLTGDVTGNVTGDVTGSLDATGGTAIIPSSVDNVHDTTPTQAQMVTALGAAAAGKVGTIDDASGDTVGYFCFSSDTSWYFLTGTKGA